MEFEFIEKDLHQLDEVNADLLVAGAFVEERPFKGLAGLVDWRMCGPLTRMALEGFITSNPGEALLMPGGGRIGVSKIVVLGLGSISTYKIKQARDAMMHMSRIIRQLKAASVVLELPGTGVVPASTVVKALVDAFKMEGLEAKKDFKVILVERSELHTELKGYLGHFFRRPWRGGHV